MPGSGFPFPSGGTAIGALVAALAGGQSASGGVSLTAITPWGPASTAAGVVQLDSVTLGVGTWAVIGLAIVNGTTFSGLALSATTASLTAISPLQTAGGANGSVVAATVVVASGTKTVFLNGSLTVSGNQFQGLVLAARVL